VDVAVLGQLSALTALHASYHFISGVGEACQVLQQLACLTRLADLNCSFSCETPELSALLPLTALRQLTHLKCTFYDNYLVSVLLDECAEQLWKLSWLPPQGADFGASLPGPGMAHASDA